MTRILVIEDDPAILDGTLETLDLEGFEVIGADNGRAGVQRAREVFPDLIISDVAMPELDGHEVLAELREDPVTATIPFIFLTARTSHQDMRQGMELGADDYLTKPYTAEELLSAVNTQLGKRAVLVGIADKKLNDLRQTIILTLPHELRTPLTSILGYAQLLADDSQPMEPSQAVEMGKHISKAGRRLYRLIENYLVYAQLELTRTNPEWIQGLRSQCTRAPQTVVRDQALLKAHQANRVDDLVLSSEDLPPMQISEHYLGKMVQELADNAFKFSKPGTPVYVFATLDDDHAVLRVTDRGRGMTRQQIADIGAYMQFNRKIHEQQGSGFGLIIARYIADLHNGNLTIQSVPEQETTISVSLPLAAPDCK